MIITKHLFREVLKSQVFILFVLLLIFFCQKLIRILSAVVDGNVPINLILFLLSSGLPEVAQLILPLSLFLGLLITLSFMFTESEITVMQACGLGKNMLIRAALMLCLITTIAAAANVVWISPWSSRYQDVVMAEAKANLSTVMLVEKQFKLTENGNSALFVNNIKNKKLEHVFLAQLKPSGNMRPSIVVAECGHMTQQPDGSQLVILDHGTRYEGSVLLRDFRITNFTQCQSIINHRTVTVNDKDTEQMTLNELWHLPGTEASAELHWRITLVISVLIMTMIVVPLSVINSRKGTALNVLPAMLLYLIFFLLQTLLRSSGAKGKIDPILWMWLTNVVYLVLALVLNLWDTVIVRRLRQLLYVRRAA